MMSAPEESRSWPGLVGREKSKEESGRRERFRKRPVTRRSMVSVSIPFVNINTSSSNQRLLIFLAISMPMASC